jgi:hypothetical protein
MEQARELPGTSTAHALKLTEDLLNILEDYLDFKFELPKLDSVVISNKDTRNHDERFFVCSSSYIDVVLLSQRLSFGA